MPECPLLHRRNPKAANKKEDIEMDLMIDQEFADKIGADAYTPDAASAADKAIELVSEAN